MRDLFTGWKGVSYAEESYRQEIRRMCGKNIDWEALLLYASKLRCGTKCRVTPHSTMGGCHLVHLLRFEDETQWIVRFQLDSASLTSDRQLQSEVDTMEMIRSQTTVPVPRVFG
jgi:hypothetical protein